MMFMTLQGRNM